MVLLLAVVVAAVLGVSGCLALVSIDIVSADPVGVALGWATVAGLSAVAALVVVILALATLFLCRPKSVALLAVVAAVVSPVVAVYLAVSIGVDVATQKATADLTTSGSAVAAVVLRVVDTTGVDIGPMHDLLIELAGSSEA